MHKMIKLRCFVEHITYQNPAYGWSVMKVKVLDGLIENRRGNVIKVAIYQD